MTPPLNAPGFILALPGEEVIDADEHLRLPRVLLSLSNRMLRCHLTVLYTNCIVATYYTMAAMPVCTKKNVAHIDRRGKS